MDSEIPTNGAIPELSDEALSEQWKNKGNDFYRAKSYKDAVDAYSSAIKANSSNAALYNNRAAAYIMLLQFKEAIVDCDRSIALENNNSKAMFRKASALKGLGNINAAIDALNSGLLVDPTSSVAMADRDSLIAAKTKIENCRTQVRNREYRKALTALDTILKDVGSNCREVNLLKVECLIELKRTEEAYNISNAMMRVATLGDQELLSLRARCFYVMGDIENAVKHLQSALRADPDNTQVRSLYRKYKDIEEKKESGNAAFKRNSLDEAIELWTAAIQLDQNNTAVVTKLYSNRAAALFKLKRYEHAIDDCSRAIRLDSSFVKAYVRRAECYFALGGKENFENCIRDYEQIGSLQSEGEEGNIDVNAKIKQAKVALKRSQQKDLYSILGVGRDADEEEIRKAYRKGALKNHPDKQSGKTDAERASAEATFKAISEAYEILSDPEKKQRYDQGVEVEDMDNPHAGAGGHGHGGMDPNMLFHMFMQQQMGGGRRGF